MGAVEKKWDWGLIVAGVLLTVCAGVCAFFPGLTLVTIAAVAGAGFLISGIGDVIFYVRFHKTMEMSGWALAYAALDIILGLMFLLHPMAFASVIPWVVSFGFLLFGIFEAVVAVKAKGLGAPMWGFSLFSGIVNVLCAIALFMFPASFALFIAFFALWRGISLVVQGITVGKSVSAD
ncbi:MAG: DUF308 domain-containing protein [Raoultibacter sp.]